MKFLSILLLSLTLIRGVSCFGQVNNGLPLFSNSYALASKEGNSIILSLHTFYDGWLYGTPELTISGQDIDGRSMHSSSKVRAVISNYHCGIYREKPSEQRTMDLQFYSKNNELVTFKGLAAPVLVQAQARGTCPQYSSIELSVVIDGTWQTDPINGTHNFKVLLN